MITTLIPVISIPFTQSHPGFPLLLFSVTHINNHHAVSPSDLTCCLIHANTHTHTFFFPVEDQVAPVLSNLSPFSPAVFCPLCCPTGSTHPAFSAQACVCSPPVLWSSAPGPPTGTVPREEGTVRRWGGHSSRNAEPLDTNAAKTKQNKPLMVRM